MTAGIRKRFKDVNEKKQHATHNVQAGREFVAAYVDYVQFVEGIHKATQVDEQHASSVNKNTEHSRHDHH